MLTKDQRKRRNDLPWRGFEGQRQRALRHKLDVQAVVEAFNEGRRPRQRQKAAY